MPRPKIAKTERTCLVCGWTTNEAHLGMDICRACTVFYRRSRGRKFPCRSNTNSCRISDGLSCRKCRLSKMDRLLAAKPVEEKRTSILCDDFTSEPSSSHSQPFSMHTLQHSSQKELCEIAYYPRVVESMVDRIIHELLHLEMAYDKIRKSNHSLKRSRMLTVSDCLKGVSKLGIDYGVAPPDPRHPPKYEFVPLEVRIREQIPFPSKPRDQVKRPRVGISSKVWDLLDMVHAIEYLKTFNFFHKLSSTDMVALARHVSLMTAMITNSYYAFEAKSDVTIYPDGYIPHGGQILRWNESDARHDREMHYGTVQRVKALCLDKREYVLIKALVTCNPAIEDLSSSSREIMQEHRDRYAKSLMVYVLGRRGSQGPSAYTAIMAHVEWLTRLGKRNKDIHVLSCALGLRNRKLSPLIEECLSA